MKLLMTILSGVAVLGTMSAHARTYQPEVEPYTWSLTTGIAAAEAPEALPNWNIVDVADGDFDGDGEPDVVALSQDEMEDGAIATHLSFFLGNGDGTLAPGGVFRLETQATDIMMTPEDVDGDGVTELRVTANDTPGDQIVPVPVDDAAFNGKYLVSGCTHRFADEETAALAWWIADYDQE